MCGILFMACNVGMQGERGIEVFDDAASPATADFEEGLMRRGPDYLGGVQVGVHSSTFTFLGSLLQLRGTTLSTNPLLEQQDAKQQQQQQQLSGPPPPPLPPSCGLPGGPQPSGAVLLFNGEVFGGLDVPPGCNDGQVLLEALTQPSAEVPAVLSRLRGPWALVFWQPTTQTLWFGRDVIGRRSLLLHLPQPGDGRLILTSSAPVDPTVPFQGYSEVAPGLYSITFSEQQQQQQWEEGARLVGRLQSHCWANPWVTWLGSFERPAALAAPGLEQQQQQAQQQQRQQQQAQKQQEQHQQQQGTASQGVVQDSASSSSNSGSNKSDRRRLAVGSDSSEAVGNHSSSQPATSAAPSARPSSASPASCSDAEEGGHSREGDAAIAVSVEEAQERAVEAVLAALRASLAVRCRCIEEHWPPSAPATKQAAASTATSNCRDSGSSGAGSSKPACAAAQPQSTPAACPTAPALGPPSPPSLPPPALAPAPVLILFSGGLDSTLMAALAHEALPPGVPIDLASICFAGGTSPDRLAALDALGELQSFAPEREWRLIQVDRSLEDVDALRGRLLRLLAPCDTVMDLNIGAALWLATEARGMIHSGSSGSSSSTGEHQQQQQQQRQKQEQQHQGQPAGSSGGAMAQAAPSSSGNHSNHSRHGTLQQPSGAVPALKGLELPADDLAAAPSGHDTQPYTSAARVVLLGHGADELCGGYGRHRTKFREGGWGALGAELALDMGRLWLRNLGRDDRLVADHGREARHPFLDEGVVAAVLEAPLDCIADLRQAPGTGDKRVLRACLRRLGLPRAAARVKRAIQFGTCLGKQSNRRDFGSNRAANARSAGALRLQDLGLGD